MACANFGGSACPVTNREQSIFGDAVTVIRIRLAVLDDVAGFAGYRLFADAQIGAEFGALKAFCGDAGDLKAGGPETHE